MTVDLLLRSCTFFFILEVLIRINLLFTLVSIILRT